MQKKGSKSSQTASKKEVADTKFQLSELSYTLLNMKSYIAACSGKPQGNDSSEANNGQEAPVSWDTIKYFGRCANKRTKTWLASPPSLGLIGLMTFIKFYLLTWLGGHNSTRDEIMKTSQINQVVSNVQHKMGTTTCLLPDR